MKNAKNINGHSPNINSRKIRNLLDLDKKLIDKLDSHEALICVIGLGYVGLPLLLSIAEAGHQCIGIDFDEKKIRQLNQDISPIRTIKSERIAQYKNTNRIRFSSSYSTAASCDVFILCLPTPLGKHREPDLSYVKAAMDSIAPALSKGKLICLESTSYPGTTYQLIVNPMQKLGFKPGEDLFIAYSPEREDPGNKDFSTCTIPKVLGGYSDSCCNVAYNLYSSFIQTVVKVSSCETAEMTKLIENIHRSVNIGMVNEMKILADKMNIDIHEVINAASTKPFGFVPYYPGPGLGGHCIPIDPFYMTWKAREYGLHTRFIELAGEINSSMPMYVVEKTINALNAKSICVNNSNILLLGVAYKKGVDDIRESPALVIASLLLEKGAKLSYADPFVSETKAINNDKTYTLKRIDLTEKSLRSFDAVILVTDHDEFDYKQIEDNSKLIIDSRGRYKKKENIISA